MGRKRYLKGNGLPPGYAFTAAKVSLSRKASHAKS